MTDVRHDHAFLGRGHAEAERNVWATIALTVATMAIEIVGGVGFGSIALIADGFHMSTHAGALLIAALAYTLARRHAADPRFTFGVGKFGDLAGFASAVALALVAVEVAFEAVQRLWTHGTIVYAAAIPIAALGLAVNLASAWLLSRGGGDHHHDHGPGGHTHAAGTERDNNLAAALVHVLADAAVSALVIVGLTLGSLFGWWFLDPLAALAGAVVIASWSYQLIRVAGAVLLDMNPDAELTSRVRNMVEGEGDALTDFHLWRLGPGHLGAIASIETGGARECEDYRRKIGEIARFSHLTVEVVPSDSRPA